MIPKFAGRAAGLQEGDCKFMVEWEGTVVDSDSQRLVDGKQGGCAAGVPEGRHFRLGCFLAGG